MLITVKIIAYYRSNLDVKKKNCSFPVKNHSILGKKLTNTGQNLDVKLKNESFSVQKSINFGQKIDKYQTNFGR